MPKVIPLKVLTPRKQIAKVNRLALQHTVNAINYIAAVITDDTAPHTVRLKAAELILDRALGKAKSNTEISVSGEVNVQHLHLAAIQDIAVNRLEKLAAGDASKASYADNMGQVIEHKPTNSKGDDAASLGL